MSTQHIPTLLAQHLQAPAKRSQHFNISQKCWAQHVARVWPPCCDMLGIENRTSAHARVWHCCTNLAKRLHHATFTNVAWKIWPFTNLSQQYPTYRNMVARRAKNVAICCVEMLRSWCEGLGESCTGTRQGAMHYNTYRSKANVSHQYCTSVTKSVAFMLHN